MVISKVLQPAGKERLGFQKSSAHVPLLMRARLSCCHLVFSESLNCNYLFVTEPHVHETFKRDNDDDDDVHGS